MLNAHQVTCPRAASELRRLPQRLPCQDKTPSQGPGSTTGHGLKPMHVIFEESLRLTLAARFGSVQLAGIEEASGSWSAGVGQAIGTATRANFSSTPAVDAGGRVPGPPTQRPRRETVMPVTRLRLRRRRARLLPVLAVAVMLLVSAVVTVVTVPAGAGTTLLSQGRPATASSAENGGTPAGAAVDGDTGTRWSSAFADPQWLQVDLGATASITRVVLTWETAYGEAFRIQVSADASMWTDIYSTTTGTGGVQTLDVSGTGRYVRMYGTVRGTQWGYSLWELQVYGSLTTASCGTGNAALDRPATASSVENGTFPASAAVDADTGTRSSSVAACRSAGSCSPGRRRTPPLSASRSPRTRRRGRISTAPPPVPVVCRPSTSPGLVATCACTAPPARPRTATRCGSSPCTPRRRSRPARPRARRRPRTRGRSGVTRAPSRPRATSSW